MGEEYCFVNELFYLEILGLLFLNVIRVEGIWCCFYLLFVLVDEMWVSDYENFVLINIKGEVIYYIKDLFSEWEFGIYIVFSDGELIYINKEYNIMRLLIVMKIKIKFIMLFNIVLIFLSVYCFFFIGNLFVGVIKDNLRIGFILYYNWDGDKMKNI